MPIVGMIVSVMILQGGQTKQPQLPRVYELGTVSNCCMGYETKAVKKFWILQCFHVNAINVNNHLFSHPHGSNSITKLLTHFHSLDTLPNRL